MANCFFTGCQNSGFIKVYAKVLTPDRKVIDVHSYICGHCCAGENGMLNGRPVSGGIWLRHRSGMVTLQEDALANQAAGQ